MEKIKLTPREAAKFALYVEQVLKERRQQSDYLPIAEAMRLFGLSRRTIYKLRERGELEFFHIGNYSRKTFIKKSHIEALMTLGKMKTNGL